jgi:hypothetical protein
MVKNKKFFIFVLLTIIIQAIVISKFNLISTEFPFLDGVPLTSSQALEYRYLLNWYLPIISISFYFSGYLSNLVKTQGAVFFVRAYSKPKWIIKQYVSIIMVLLLFIIFQTVIFSFMRLGNSVFSIENFIKSFSIYFLTLLTLFSIQQLLELYIKPEIAHLIVNVYIVLSILITTDQQNVSSFSNYFLLPNYGMGFKNGLSQIPEFKMYIIDYFRGIIVLLIIQFTVIGLSIKRIKKMDLI